MTTTKEDDSEIPAPKSSSSAGKKWAESVSLNVITARRCAILPVGGGKPLAALENIPRSNNKIKEGKWEVMSSSVFFPLFNISGLFFFFPETGNRAQIHKHSLYFIFLSQCCGSHMGWKVELTRSFGWALKKICFVYFLESQVRRNPTTETTRLSKRLVFYFLLRWHERLYLWAPTLLTSPKALDTHSQRQRGWAKRCWSYLTCAALSLARFSTSC